MASTRPVRALRVPAACRYDEELVAAIEPFVYEWTTGVKGSISAEHGVGIMKAGAIHYSQSQEALKVGAGPCLCALVLALPRRMSPMLFQRATWLLPLAGDGPDQVAAGPPPPAEPLQGPPSAKEACVKCFRFNSAGMSMAPSDGLTPPAHAHTRAAGSATCAIMKAAWL